ncbi:MAG: 4-hydroxy-tetrahydrodipicolinate synthase [Candidatus Omnitrophica bacterium CG12_big_fil_rev_8_21_14_0_65_43_15]|uniref:4-hydroxy-tetrahydrodipicolinate synthase n=1 Tax=Candidatus Taenaricola geysiri TaxID=1974752 RepID=A0A2J0LE97_9BACT|nr:MAG: 4-hydroxy-tetrahydrodipicolinate synthase [Candidatus Omnitrophica bacterium CG1_02_43_210]PIR65424.1 MAG: 4-hydroxy-tetrahydrodipicolinate synthase [Candidatus Omnitrophica bacterium CG10_big_fil_rev_8_21_14_0_10_43_8]PIV12523.1 MAG: 4-hydroxy-tetrahydrodipicolinate synthase [Candidatus Omnitrophica bacterium CG03_land_8_20_14_0_80_43_22]PIW66182.1 MAG: 4-hydroxy-tetrahydrodipicolinate synthase [Candidatus Omnitrophica bacterium CG12_big_fil_rev_8_21_14_0_65_43_15]PIW80240.1 MAG: 4-hyd
MSLNLKGSMVALVTPFKNDKVDEGKLKELVEFHIENGTKAVIPCGTTGESATLSLAEHDRVVEVVTKIAKKRITVIAGSGSNNTKEAIRLTRHAKDVGADAALLISPYYNRPTQQGLYLHFKAVADAVDIPIVLYNIASRTGVNIEPETIAELAKIKNIVGVKEASGNLDQMSRIAQLCGDEFALISGDDSLTLPLMAIGGTGVISVVANIAPKDVADLVDSFLKGDLRHAKKMHYKLLPLIKAMFIETNPIPVKTAMGLMGMIEPGLRLPMCDMKPENLAKLRKALKDYGLLK